jgi:hypothetical protein
MWTTISNDNKQATTRHGSITIIIEVIDSFKLRNKVSHIVSDSASNMTKAFEVNLPQFMIDEVEDGAASNDDENDEGSLDAIGIDPETGDQLLSCIPESNRAHFADRLRSINEAF